VRQAALVSDESALEMCLRQYATQIDDLLPFFVVIITVCSMQCRARDKV